MSKPTPRPTWEVRPFWVQGSDASTGDRYLCRPGVVAYLCFSDDRLVTWEFAPPLPGSMAEAMEVVNGPRSV